MRAGALASAASAAGYTGAAANPSVAPALRGATGATGGYPVAPGAPAAAAKLPGAPGAGYTGAPAAAVPGALARAAAKLVSAGAGTRTKPNRSKNSQEAADAGRQLEGNQTKDHLNKIRKSLDELREIVNKKTNSKDKEQLLDKLDAIINTVERISRRLTDEAADPEAADPEAADPAAADPADPAEAEAGQAQQLTAEEAIAIIAVAIVSCVGNVYACVKCNEGFANTFNRFCCFLDPFGLWIVPRLERIDELIGYTEDDRVAPNLGTTTLGQPVDPSSIGLGVGIGFP